MGVWCGLVGHRPVLTRAGTCFLSKGCPLGSYRSAGVFRIRIHPSFVFGCLWDHWWCSGPSGEAETSSFTQLRGEAWGKGAPSLSPQCHLP